MKFAITRSTFLMVAAGAIVAAQPVPGSGQPPDPARMIERRIERLSTLLNLAEAQKAQAKTIFETEQSSLQALREQVRGANQALRESVQSNRTDTEIDTLAGVVGTLHGRTLAIQTKASAQFYRILTPEQRDKLAALGPGDRGAGPGMGPGGFGPAGRGPRGPAFDRFRQ